MAKKKKFGRFMSTVTTDSMFDEVADIAVKHETSKGRVIRTLIRYGLVAYYQKGSRLDAED